MSYTITQQATSPNAAYTRLIYTVSGSTKSSEPQFSYLVDVYESGSSSRVARLVQQVNPAGVSVFDPSRIFQGELSQDESWKISSVTPFNSSSKTFTLEFGEQYGTSTSSSITVSSSIATNNIEVFRGVVDPNAGYYNWDSASYAVLSNMPATMSMQFDDHGTISLYNNTVVYVSQSFYSASSISGNYEVVEQNNYSITDNFSSVPISSSTPYWNYAQVNISSSVGLEEYRYEVSDKINNEKTRFAFINKLGAWDYYNNYNPVRQSINVKREQYTAPRVDYSSLTSTYDISRRGLSDYHNSTNDSFVIDTDYLDKTNANWLEELIESPSVYIQRNGEFIPIVVNDSNYIANTNQARQKLFKYSITFTPSNQPFGKWEPEYVTCPKQLILIPEVITTAASTITTSSMEFNGNITTAGTYDIDKRGFAYSTSSSDPIISDDFILESTGPYTSGAYTIDSGPLFQTSSLVYFKAFVSTSLDIYYADNVISASTLDFTPIQAVTNAPTDVTATEFTMNGTIPGGSTKSVIERGFVLSKTDSTPEIDESDVLKYITGSGAGVYDYTIPSSDSYFSMSQNYYYRAYGSSSGNELAYGATEQFTTDVFTTPVLTTTLSGSSYRDLYVVTMDGNITTGTVAITERGFAYSSQSAVPDISSSNSITSSIAGGPGGAYQFIYTASNAGTEYYGRSYAKYSYLGDDYVFYGNIASSSTPAFSGSLRDLDPYAGGTISTGSLLYWYDFTDPAVMDFTSSTAYSDYRKIVGVSNKGIISSASVAPASLTTGSSPTLEQGFTQFHTGSSKLSFREGASGNGFYPGFDSSSLTTAIYFSFVDIDNLGNLTPNLVKYEGMEGTNGIWSVGYIRATGTNTIQNSLSSVATYSSASSDLSPNPPGANRFSIYQELYTEELPFDAGELLVYTYSGSALIPKNSWQSNFLITSCSDNGVSQKMDATITAGRAIGGSELSASLTTSDAKRGGSIAHSGLTFGQAQGEFKLAHFLLYTGSLSDSQISAVINDFSASVTYGNELNSKSN